MDQRTDQGQAASNAESQGGWGELLAPRHAVTTAMLCIGVALYAFNGFLVATALPTAVEELGGAAVISWSLSLYLGASIVAGASAALLKQRFGGRATLIGAALVFLAGTLLAAAATDMSGVLAGRLLQGVGEGVVAAICYALIPDMFPSRLVPKVFGAEASVWALAAFGGPVAAGLLTQAYSWRAAFYVNVPVIALFIVLAATIVPRQTGKRITAAIPGSRLALLSTGLGAAMLSAVAPSIAVAFALLGLSGLAFAAMLRFDRRATHSILPAGAFSLHSTLGLGLWVVLMMPVAQATSSVYLVFSLQHLWGFAPAKAGALSALMAICWSTSAIVIANLRSERHQRSMIWIGVLLQLTGLTAQFAGIASGHLALVVTAQVLIGTAFGISWAYLSQTLMNATPAAQRDKTSALLPTLQSAGFALGGALAGLAANAGGLAAATTPEAMRLPLSIAFFCAIVWAVPGLFAARRAVRPGLIEVRSE